MRLGQLYHGWIMIAKLWIELLGTHSIETATMTNVKCYLSWARLFEDLKAGER